VKLYGVKIKCGAGRKWMSTGTGEPWRGTREEAEALAAPRPTDPKTCTLEVAEFVEEEADGPAR
jgi:hypothetical protein